MQHPGVQAALFEHILEPFAVLDEITGGQDKEGWNFVDGDFSCYTYLSILGMGHALAFMSVFVQVVLPSVLLWSTLEDVGESMGRLPVCPASGQTVNKLTLLCILLFYSMTVVPSQISLLCVPLRARSLSLPLSSDDAPPPHPPSHPPILRSTTLVGSEDSTKSKLASFRRALAEQAEDSFSQNLGYRLDYFFNTGVKLCAKR